MADLIGSGMSFGEDVGVVIDFILTESCNKTEKMDAISTDLPSPSFDSSLMYNLSMTNTLLPVFLLSLLLFSDCRSFRQRSSYRWSEKVINRRRLGASPSRRLVRQSKVSVTEFSSFLKQDHKWKWDSTWSSPVRRRSGWRVPLAMDRAQWKKSKPIQTFFQYVHSPTVYMWLSL